MLSENIKNKEVVRDINPSRKEAAEEIAKAIINGEIDYRGLQDKKSEVTKKLSCETPSNDEIFEIVEEIDQNALKRFLESKERYGKIKKEKKEIEEIKHRQLITPKIYPLLIFFALLVYYGYFINIDFFFDWDTLATAISMKEGTFDLLRSFTSYHMLVSPLAYLFTLLSSPFIGWKPLVGWKILVSLCAAGAGTMLYITVYKLTKNYLHAFIAMAFLAGTYGYLFLTLSLEDNIINSLFNMVFIFFLLAQIGDIKLNIVKKNINILSFLTGASLGLGIATHIHSMLFIPLILTIFYFKRENGLLENIKEILTIVVGSVAVVSPFIIINAYAYHWNSVHDLINFFTIGYHKDPNLYYFANPNRDIWRQLEYVNWGWTSMFFQRYQELLQMAPNFLIYSKFLLSILAVVFGGFMLSSIKTKTTQIMLLMLLVMIPHSIFYESWNVERWVDILLPTAVIMGNSLKIEKNESKAEIYTKIEDFYAEHGVKIAIAIVTILFICSIASFNTLSHFQKNPVHKLADEIDGKTEEDAVVVMGIRSTSEFGLYVKYAANRELFFLSDRSPEEILREIDLRLSNNKPVYISTIAASTLIQSNPELETKYSYELVVDNGYYSLYKVLKSEGIL
jgi:hypothetical protein